MYYDRRQTGKKRGQTLVIACEGNASFYEASAGLTPVCVCVCVLARACVSVCLRVRRVSVSVSVFACVSVYLCVGVDGWAIRTAALNFAPTPTHALRCGPDTLSWVSIAPGLGAAQAHRGCRGTPTPSSLVTLHTLFYSRLLWIHPHSRIRAAAGRVFSARFQPPRVWVQHRHTVAAKGRQRRPRSHRLCRQCMPCFWLGLVLFFGCLALLFSAFAAIFYRQMGGSPLPLTSTPRLV